MRKILVLLLMTTIMSFCFAGEWEVFLSFSFGDDGFFEVGIEGVEVSAFAFSASSFAFTKKVLYIADSVNNRVLLYNPFGKPMKILDTSSKGIHWYSKILALLAFVCNIKIPN